MPRRHPQDIRLLALDIDDTLIGPDGRLSEANVAAVEAARRAGVYVTLITGRRYRESAERFACELGVDGPIGCHYGRATVLHPAGDFVSRRVLDTDVCRRLMAFAREHDLLPSLCADEIFFFPQGARGPAVGSFPLAQWLDDLGQVVDERAGRIMSFSVSGTDAGQVRDLLAAEIAAGDVTVYHQWLTGRDQSLAVVLAGGDNKGTALVRICGLLGVQPAQAVAMGDSEADVSMMRAAGFGISMPWADQEVREAADWVAGGPPESAVAYEIRRLLGLS